MNPYSPAGGSLEAAPDQAAAVPAGAHPDGPAMTRSGRWWAVNGLVSAGLLALLLLGFSVHLPGTAAELAARLRAGVQPGPFLLAFLLYGLVVALRAWRFGVLAGGGVARLDMLAVTAAHNLWNTFLPLKLGEFSYPLLLVRVGGASPGAGLAQLALMRLLDAVAMLVFALVCIPLACQLPPGLLILLAGVALLLALLAAALLRWPLRLLARLEAAWPGEGRLRQRLMPEIRNFFTSLHGLPRQAVVGAVLLTPPTWAVFYATDLVLFRMAGLDLGYAAIVAAGSTLIPLAVLPVQGVAGLGTYEAAMAGGLVAVGQEAGPAVCAALAVHFCGYAFVLALGGAGHAWLTLRRRAARPAAGVTP